MGKFLILQNCQLILFSSLQVLIYIHIFFKSKQETSRQSEMSVLLGHIIQHLTHLRQGWLYVDIFGNEEVSKDAKTECTATITISVSLVLLCRQAVRPIYMI